MSRWISPPAVPQSPRSPLTQSSRNPPRYRLPLSRTPTLSPSRRRSRLRSRPLRAGGVPDSGDGLPRRPERMDARRLRRSWRRENIAAAVDRRISVNCVTRSLPSIARLSDTHTNIPVSHCTFLSCLSVVHFMTAGECFFFDPVAFRFQWFFPIFSGVTRVGVTRGGNSWYHLFFLKNWRPFSVIALWKVLTFFNCRLFTTPALPYSATSFFQSSF